MPKDTLFKNQAEALAAAKDSGLVLLPCADPLHAMWGIGGWRPDIPPTACPRERAARRRNPEERFLYPRFDHALEMVRREVTPIQLTETMKVAQPGLFGWHDDQDTRLLQACVYDLEKGISFVSWLTLSKMRFDKSGATAHWIANGWTSAAGRYALGGYAEERQRVYDELKDVLPIFQP